MPWLKPEHKKARLSWAKARESFTAEKWGKVIWLDECYVYLGNNKGRIYVTRRVDEVLDENCLVPSFKQSSLRVMV